MYVSLKCLQEDQVGKGGADLLGLRITASHPALSREAARQQQFTEDSR